MSSQQAGALPPTPAVASPSSHARDFLSRQRARVTRLLARLGWRVQRLDAHSQRYLLSSYDDSAPMPPQAAELLRADHPRLESLRKAYSALSLPMTRHSHWSDRQIRRNLDMRYFRGDNVYVWQYRQWRSEARLKQYLAVLDVQSRDRLGLLQKLQEDGLFGVWCFRYGDKPPVSRDLIDSVNEINYLDEHLQIASKPGLRFLDIGAGYGRLAHRMCTALPNIEAYDCVDAIPESTYLCDYYLQFHKVPHARSVPLHEHHLLHDRYDVAVNIHSFSECTREAVRGWLDLIAARSVPWLLVIPNDPEAILSSEDGGGCHDLVPEIEARGYALADKRPFYGNPELRQLIGVHDHFFLFRHRGAGAR